MYGISKKSLISSFGVFAIALTLSYSNSVFAQVGSPTNPAPTQKHRHHGKGFQRGVCVGQTLAQEGIVLPPRVPGQRPALDPATKAAFKAAMQSCRAQYKGSRTPAS